jgi:hypothetical protein
VFCIPLLTHVRYANSIPTHIDDAHPQPLAVFRPQVSVLNDTAGVTPAASRRHLIANQCERTRGSRTGPSRCHSFLYQLNTKVRCCNSHTPCDLAIGLTNPNRYCDYILERP